MQGHNWDKVQEIFFQAADLPGAERAAFLERACQDDGGMRAEVESLLRADSADGSAIAAAIESEVTALLDGRASRAGTRMGPYRLLKEIGRGGMGSVYLGERDDEHFRKLVAIKVVKRGMDSAEVLARFRHERQILAGLEHPYIARLIDGGSTPDGQPFFVMEYVPGQPIDVYCREHALNLEARLRLFLRVCEAVSYAHRALVVHRDLKPSNILVSAEGIPKLLDFGVAKLLDPSHDAGLTVTATAAGPLTPEYASPEQIRGLPITTAADVYALGAILFEVLTGRRAQRFETHTPSEIERVVCQTDTPRPSSVARTQHAAQRLNADLDNIVLMAMRKDPERRYGSVNRLADDITLHLEGRPVLARPDSVVYRTHKFVLRNSLALAATFLVLLSLFGGMVLAERQARRAESARRFAETQRQSAELERARAEAQRQLAERERARAEAEAQVARTEGQRSQRRLAQMLELADSSLFDVHTAIEKLPGATEARRQIVVTTLRFLEDLSKDAGQDEDLRFMLSASYFKVANVQGFPLQPNLGDTKAALANYRKSVAMIEPLLAHRPDRPKYLLQWVQTKVNWATLLHYSGEVRRAVDMMVASVPAAQRLHRMCPQDVQCALAEGQVYSVIVNALATRDTTAALRYARLETQVTEQVLRDSPHNRDVQLELGIAYSVEAKILNARGELPEALERYRRAAALKERGLALNPSDVLTRRSLMITYGNLAGGLGSPLFPNLGDTAGAREYYGKALAIARDLARADANDRLAQFDLANALLFRSVLNLPKEDWPQALADLLQAEDILQKQVAIDPQSVVKLRTLAIAQEYAGRRLEDVGRRDQGVAKVRQSLATTEKGLARSPSDMSLISQAMASEEIVAEMLARQGDRTEALDFERQAMARAQQYPAAQSERVRVTRSVAIAYQSLATVEVTCGNWKEAQAAAQRSMDAWQQVMASDRHRADPEKVASAEAMLERCNAHVH